MIRCGDINKIGIISKKDLKLDGPALVSLGDKLSWLVINEGILRICDYRCMLLKYLMWYILPSINKFDYKIYSDLDFTNFKLEYEMNIANGHSLEDIFTYAYKDMINMNNLFQSHIRLLYAINDEKPFYRMFIIKSDYITFRSLIKANKNTPVDDILQEYCYYNGVSKILEWEKIKLWEAPSIDD